MTKPIKEPTKAVQRHAVTMFDAMKAQAKREKLDNHTYLVYRGKITQTWAAIGVSYTYYSNVLTILKYNGCIEELQSGSKNIESVYVLHQRPKDASELVLPDELKDSRPKPLTDNPAFAKLVDRVEALEKLVGGVDVGGALIEVDGRLTKLGA